MRKFPCPPAEASAQFIPWWDAGRGLHPPPRTTYDNAAKVGLDGKTPPPNESCQESLCIRRQDRNKQLPQTRAPSKFMGVLGHEELGVL
jgi:hypothetical protein